jgi:dynein light chain Tctex-type 1
VRQLVIIVKLCALTRRTGALPPHAVEAKSQHWVDAICDRCMAGLHGLNKPFKYVVTAAVVQKNGAGVHAGHSAYWDIGADNLCQVSWPTDKMREQQGSRIKCIVTAFGLSL